jgi:hypothetical protein
MLFIRSVCFITALSTAAVTGYPGGCRLSVRLATVLGALIKETPCIKVGLSCSYERKREMTIRSRDKNKGEMGRK